MFYLADFKRKYEKWLNSQEENKEVIIPELNTANKKRKVSEIKNVIENARRNNLKQGRKKTTKTYIDSQKRLRKYTGGNSDNQKLTVRQKRIKELTGINRENYLRKQANKVLTPSDRPLVSFPKDSKLETVKQEAPKIIKSLPPAKETTTVKNPQSQMTRRITRNHVTKNRIGRKIILGVGVLGAGLYGINKLRKSRSDKNKKRGKYNTR